MLGENSILYNIIERLKTYLLSLLLILTTACVYGQAVTIDSLTVTYPGCGNADGSILIHASGGGTQLIYSIDGGTNTQSDSLFQNLTNSAYQIVVSDSAGFSDTLNYVLIGVGGLSIDAITTNPITCNGNDDGSVNIIVSGGTGSYVFELTGDTTQTNGNFTNLGPGNYIVIITDGNFCEDTAQFIIFEPLPVSFTNSTTDANCPAADGSIDITANGGDGSFQYSIDNGTTFQASSTFTGLSAGSYTVVVMDGAGCTDTASVFVNSAPGTGPDILTLNFINPLCNGSNNGSITIMAIGNPPIQYSVDGGQNFQAGSTFTSLAPGVYNIIVEDADGCPVGSTIIIQEPAVLESGITVLDETCVPGNGSIIFNTTGGTPSYQYSINGGAGFSSNPNFNNLSGGTYQYIAEDQNGCTDTGTVVLQSGGGPTIDSITVIEPTCPLDSNGLLVIHASSQSPPIQYSINNGVVFFPTDSFPNLPSDVYDVVLIDADGCTTSQSVILTGPSTPVADFIANPTTGFIPLTVNFTDNSVGATSYSWDFGDNNSSTQANPSNTYANAGTYTVIQTVSDGACTDTASIVIYIEGEPSITVPNVFTPNDDGYNDTFYPEVVGITSLHGIIYNRYGAIVYEWFGPEGWWDGHTAPAGQQVAEGTYYYVITATAVNGSNFEEKGFVTLLRQAPFKR